MHSLAYPQCSCSCSRSHPFQWSYHALHLGKDLLPLLIPVGEPGNCPASAYAQVCFQRPPLFCPICLLTISLLNHCPNDHTKVGTPTEGEVSQRPRIDAARVTLLELVQKLDGTQLWRAGHATRREAALDGFHGANVVRQSPAHCRYEIVYAIALERNQLRHNDCGRDAARE